MTPGDGACEGNKAQSQQYFMHAAHPPEASIGVPVIRLLDLATQHEGLNDEQHQGKDGPHQNHRVHPPVPEF